MRTFIFVGFLACMLFAICEAKTCTSTSDCDADECCVGVLSMKYCYKRNKEGHFCLTNIEDLKESGVYKFTCPCADGLECKTVTTQLGMITFKMDKCVKKE